MLPLTLAIVARDEADRIGAAIRSVPFAAEVIVLDSGSTDGTPEVARRLGARVMETDWPGYVAQKERAWRAATQPWVLSLDADERLSPALAEQIVNALSGEAAVAGFALLRHNLWLGNPVRAGALGPRWHARLARRDAATWTGEDPHDRLEVRGALARLDGALLHEPYRDLGEHLATIDRYGRIFVEQSRARGRRSTLLDVTARPFLHFVKVILLKGGWRDGAMGLALAWLGATHVALKWARLYLDQGAPP